MLSQITTERLILRPFRPEDVQDYHRLIYNDPEVMRFLPGGEPRELAKAVRSIDHFINYEAEYGFTLWALELHTPRQFLGHCGLYILAESGGKVEMAYAIGRAWWGRGFTTEAARAAARYGFEVCGLPVIYALAVPENIGSRRVMEKIGMRYLGINRQYHNGSELAMYGVERQDFAPGDHAYDAQWE